MGSMKENYMNPITLEAEMFVQNFNNLSKTHNFIDAVLVSSLEKVMATIENFLDSNPKEIVPTENTNVVECKVITNITRIYHCTKCKSDVGKSAEKAIRHLVDKCSTIKKRNEGAVCHQHQPDVIRKINDTNSTNLVHRSAVKETPREKRNSEKETDIIKISKKTRALLTTDLNNFFDDNIKIATKLKCMSVYDDIERDLLQTIIPSFPDQKIKIYKFGSRIAGIGSRDSDIDLYIDIGDTFHVFQHRPSDEVLAKMKYVDKAITSNRKIWKVLRRICNARVPILRVIHEPSSIECDINVSNSLGTVNTRFLEYIFNIQPIARLLCIFMKKWLSRTKLDSQMSSYSFSLMVLFYLQRMQVIPSMEALQQNINLEKALTVGPWLYTYATLTLNELNISLEILDQSNVLKFIKGFFTFYEKFNFNDNIVCPYLGKVVQKTDVANLMPSRYAETPDYPLQLDKPIVVQDPLQLNHNTTKSLTKTEIKNIKILMSKSLDTINEIFRI